MPQWTNNHTYDCNVNVNRRALWKELARTPTSASILGALPRWDNDGDLEKRECNCGFFPPEPLPAPYLMWQQARAVALALRAFAETTKLVLGPEWRERLPADSSKGLTNLAITARILIKWADRLDHLADIWDRG